MSWGKGEISERGENPLPQKETSGNKGLIGGKERRAIFSPQRQDGEKEMKSTKKKNRHVCRQSKKRGQEDLEKEN